ncbi:MAG: hypothetical protein ACOYXT_25945 [Bacteroidota bacterium]
MSVPKPPFHSAIEELLYNIYLKLPDMTYLTESDINTLAKLNAIILDGDLLTANDVTNAINTLKGNVSASGDTLEKLYNIIQGLNFLKQEDIDTLAEINAIITDADLARISDISALLDSVPDAGNTLHKLFTLIGGKQDTLGTTFPNTLFVSPTGNDLTATKGDFSKPFTPQGAALAAAVGDTMSFLPGDYTINSNIAKNGVAYTTYGGKVKITVNLANSILFNFDSLPDSALDVTVTGDFAFALSGNGVCIFDFKTGNTKRNYNIKWLNAHQSGGAVFMKMPTRGISTGIFEGNIDMETDAILPAIQCRNSEATEGAGVFRLQIHNKSTASQAISPWFSGFMFTVSYQATTYGLFAAPLNAGSDKNEYILNLKQGGPCTTVLGSGNYSLTVDGGTIQLFNGSSLNIKGKFSNCILSAGPQTASNIIADANAVTIINDQVQILKLDGVWRNCSYSKTSQNLCILAGQFYDIQFNTSVGILKLTGYVRLLNTTSLTVNANEYLEVTGKLVGSALQIILLNQRAPVVISGFIKQLGEFSPVLKSSGGGATHLVSLKNAVLEAGASASGIQIDAPDGLDLKMYGLSYCNKGIAGTGAINYLVGKTQDFIVDPDVEIISG